MRTSWLLAVVPFSLCESGGVSTQHSASSRPGECVRDDDCVLLPSALTCCIECPPAPPFEARPQWVLDGMLIDAETYCAEPRLCPEMHCEPVLETCEARAVCDDGRCTAVASGCDRPTS